MLQNEVFKYVSAELDLNTYFKDSSVAFSDMLCFDLAVALSTKNN